MLVAGLVVCVRVCVCVCMCKGNRYRLTFVHRGGAMHTTSGKLVRQAGSQSACRAALKTAVTTAPSSLLPPPHLLHM